MSDELSRLGPEQRELVSRWLPGAAVVADLSWGLVDATVLELVSDGSVSS